MDFQIKHKNTKTLTIRENSRSSDFITPSFIESCAANCLYCFTYRFQKGTVYINDNVDSILKAILNHSESLPIKIPNQVDPKYWVYDVGCSVDISYHWKDYDWEKVFRFFTETPNIKATFATKFVNNKLLPYGNEKLRIRFSLMPQKVVNVVESNTSTINTRITAIDRFIENGWEVHLNFSPIICYKGWLENYKLLFKELNQKLKYKDNISCECIFLTHNNNLHELNLKQGYSKAESLLWVPPIQETKTSEYGGKNVRYNYKIKDSLIEQFKQLHQELIPWCKIRYIF